MCRPLSRPPFRFLWPYSLRPLAATLVNRRVFSRETSDQVVYITPRVLCPGVEVSCGFTSSKPLRNSSSSSNRAKSSLGHPTKPSSTYLSKQKLDLDTDPLATRQGQPATPVEAGSPLAKMLGSSFTPHRLAETSRSTRMIFFPFGRLLGCRWRQMELVFDAGNQLALP